MQKVKITLIMVCVSRFCVWDFFNFEFWEWLGEGDDGGEGGEG